MKVSKERRGPPAGKKERKEKGEKSEQKANEAGFGGK